MHFLNLLPIAFLCMLTRLAVATPAPLRGNLEKRQCNLNGCECLLGNHPSQYCWDAKYFSVLSQWAAQPSTSAPSSLFGTSNFRRTDRSRVADSREGIPMQNLTPAGTSVRRGVSLGRGVASHSNSASRQRRRSCGMSWLCLGFGSNSEPGEHPEPHPGEHLHNTRQDIGDEDEEPILVPDEGPLPNPALDPAQNPSANIARQLLVKSGEIEEISGPPTDAPGQSSNGGRLPEILEEVPADDGGTHQLQVSLVSPMFSFSMPCCLMVVHT
ncbi:uncharacterized protein LAJ45_00186 [Morchella importuna]|uniref:uncharacterized protein n=1 Tax=Morchella importuna TaxID=1174673 RepID=UPI001E8CC951|nr:uncharacterized protein LAJ45_00186 [Morchella importuna]KAH8155177.1 hypothetical protein LAJ45_00186 [Morchella importuna]